MIAEAALDAPDLPVDLAYLLADRLGQLATAAVSLGPEQRGLARGALEYFLLTGDVDNDLDGPHGLDDDRLVLNEACRRIGREDLVIN